MLGFPGGSVGKESTRNAGDTEDVNSIAELGRFLGGGCTDTVTEHGLIT